MAIQQKAETRVSMNRRHESTSREDILGSDFAVLQSKTAKSDQKVSVQVYAYQRMFSTKWSLANNIFLGHSGVCIRKRPNGPNNLFCREVNA